MAESLRDYFVSLFFKTDKTGAATMQSTVERITTSVNKLGATALAINSIATSIRGVLAPFEALGSLVARTAAEADELQELSDRTGIATQDLERFGFVAKMSGTSLEAFTKGMRFLEKSMVDALDGGKEQTEMFAKLGVSIRGTGGKLKTVEQILPEVSAAFEKLPTHAQKSAYAMKLFGKAGQDLLPMLAKGPAAIREMQIELEQLGGVTSEQFLEAAGKWDDNIHRLTAAWKGVRQAISGPIVAKINELAEGFLKWWRAAGAVIRSGIVEWTQQFVDSLDALWNTLTRIGAPLLAFAALLNAPFLVMLGIRLMIGLIIDDFNHWMAGNDSLIGRAIANWDRWLTELAKTNPVVAGMLSYFGDFVSWLHGAVKKLGKDWDEFLGIVTSDSFSAGDTIKAFFASIADFMTQPIEDAWYKIRDLIFDTMLKMKGAAKSLGLDSLAESLGGAAAGFMRSTVAVKDQQTNVPSARGPSILGPSSVPSAVSQSTANTNTSISAPISISVTAAPGMDEQKIAEIAAKKVSDHLDSTVRSSFNQLVPERY